jgi:manganese-dependent ADP-ribose/CDP-alcohol diphosphatase
MHLKMTASSTKSQLPHPPTPSSPLFRFGLISDVQYADLPDGTSFHGTPRFYRHALVSLKRAVTGMQREHVACCLHMGDIVDYHNSVHGASEAALEAVLTAFDDLPAPTLHMIGNHCLYNAPRHVLNASLGISGHQGDEAGTHSYYTFQPAPGWRFIVLDG